MIGKDALIKLLRHEGVKYVFGIPGATEILFMDALEENPDIQYILGLNEIGSGFERAKLD
jgi:benzoylformate decarboxylase